MAARRSRKTARKPRSARDGSGNGVRLDKSDTYLDRVMDVARGKANVARGTGDHVGSKMYMSIFHSAARDSFERPHSERRGWAPGF